MLPDVGVTFLMTRKQLHGDRNIPRYWVMCCTLNASEHQEEHVISADMTNVQSYLYFAHLILDWAGGQTIGGQANCFFV